MCKDTSAFTADENRLLDIFRNLYEEVEPRARCQPGIMLKKRFSSVPDEPRFNAALRGLLRRGCITDDGPHSCLTDCGMRVLRLLPAEPANPC
jgi:hypothetical protein